MSYGDLSDWYIQPWKISYQKNNNKKTLIYPIGTSPKSCHARDCNRSHYGLIYEIYQMIDSLRTLMEQKVAAN